MRGVLGIVVGLAMGGAAFAQAGPPVAVKDIRMQLFLEKSGTWSENIVGAKKSFHNTVIGEGDAGEPASSVLVTIEVSGPPNGTASTALARDMANVTVTQETKSGAKRQLRAVSGFRFNEKGLAYRAFVVENGTCAPLEVEVKLGRSRKVAKVDFKCGE